MSKKENKLLKEEEKILNFLDKASNDELISYFEEKKEQCDNNGHVMFT